MFCSEDKDKARTCGLGQDKDFRLEDKDKDLWSEFKDKDFRIEDKDTDLWSKDKDKARTCGLS